MNSCATMTNSTLFVFDTNTLVSALLFASSTPSLAFQKAQKSGFFVCSDETFAELSEVLMRPKFDRYLSQESRHLFLKAYERSALWTTIVQRVTDCRDSKDNKFLEVAINTQATWLISGDADLLVLHPYHDVQILTPATWLSVDDD